MKCVLLIPLQTKCNVSSQEGLAYLNVVIDLPFTVSLMLLRQLNQVLRSASPARKHNLSVRECPCLLPQCQLCCQCWTGLPAAGCVCYSSAEVALGTCQEHPACGRKTLVNGRERTLFISDLSFGPHTLRLLHRNCVQAMPL